MWLGGEDGKLDSATRYGVATMWMTGKNSNVWITAEHWPTVYGLWIYNGMTLEDTLVSMNGLWRCYIQHDWARLVLLIPFLLNTLLLFTVLFYAFLCLAFWWQYVFCTKEVILRTEKTHCYRTRLPIHISSYGTPIFLRVPRSITSFFIASLHASRPG